ncbi:bifunctional DNA primase/polymerase [Prescottella equi]|uniref:bifunctional DNA primase/polymerase n=1 Tax=Rhodococcus hoagii TaxID=43767 RepID=UPI001C7795B1|nr:bifunctional DNA primase/polymerase [Prescottella equi]BCN82704.1 hypothetical protein RE0356_13450 [Prescottella equi]
MKQNDTTAHAAQQTRKAAQGNNYSHSVVDCADGTKVLKFRRRLYVPESVNEMSPMDAALAYAEAGWFVLPVRPGTKNPGSVVGSGWPKQSTRDAEQISRWWGENPDFGIALHTGRSGAVVFDLDTDELPALPASLREALAHGQFQSTRGGANARGHYLFAVPSGESYGNSAGAFAAFGDVRGKNGVIIAAPTPHVDAETQGGGYEWRVEGPVPDLPEALRACLRDAPEGEAEPMTEADLGDFFTEYTANNRPGALSGVLKVFEQDVAGGMSRHEALVRALPMAYREAVVGCYPAQTATAEIQEAFNASFHRSVGGGRSRPAPDEFARTARWAAAQALLADPVETLARLNRDEFDLRERESVFWAARPELRTVHQFAQARMVAPWALFGSVLARALSIVPPRVVLPALVGSHGSVNSFIALVGPSGAGKSVTRGAARDVLTLNFEGETRLHVRNVGSGEGLVDQFATYDAKAKAYVGLRTRVMFTVDEVETLTAQGARSGSTLMPTLRTAWTGDSLGFANRDKTKAIPVEAHRYRLTMVVGVQPTKAQPLLDDADGGTPQRFLWMPTADPDVPEVEPAEPDPITVGPWPQPQPQSNSGFNVNRPTSEVALVTVPATGREFTELTIPDHVRDEVRSQRRRVLRGDADVNPLDGHALMTRLKVAVGLMVLNGRYDTVTDEDWNLAGVVMEVSNRTRREVEKAIAAEAHTANQSRGKAEAQREIAKAEVLQKDGLARICNRIMERLNEVGAMERSAVRSFLGRDKNLMDEAVELLAARGEVDLDRYAAKNGSATWRITAKAQP